MTRAVKRLNTPPTPAEQQTARWAYGIGIVGLGWLAASILLLARGRQSRFVRFHMIQVIGFDIVGVVFLFALFVIWVMVIPIVAGSPEALLTANLTILSLMGLLILAMGVARATAFVHVWRGKDFHYPWLGEKIASYLAPYEND
jgi:uncharacterized membrane protein